jgi:hypothetical protein
LTDLDRDAATRDRVSDEPAWLGRDDIRMDGEAIRG